MPKKTREVLDSIDLERFPNGVPDHVVRNLIRFRKLHPAPQKDSSGDYVWTAEDVERLRRAIAQRPRAGRAT